MTTASRAQTAFESYYPNAFTTYTLREPETNRKRIGVYAAAPGGTVELIAAAYTRARAYQKALRLTVSKFGSVKDFVKAHANVIEPEDPKTLKRYRFSVGSSCGIDIGMCFTITAHTVAEAVQIAQDALYPLRDGLGLDIGDCEGLEDASFYFGPGVVVVAADIVDVEDPDAAPHAYSDPGGNGYCFVCGLIEGHSEANHV